MRRPHSGEAEDVGSYHLDHSAPWPRSQPGKSARGCVHSREKQPDQRSAQLAWCQTAKSYSCTASECHGVGFLS